MSPSAVKIGLIQKDSAHSSIKELIYENHRLCFNKTNCLLLFMGRGCWRVVPLLCCWALGLGSEQKN